MTQHPSSFRMSDEEFADKHPVAAALRAAGYLPLPRRWIPAEKMPEIHKLTDPFCYQVNKIRASVKGQTYTPKEPDPKEDKDAAWAAYEKSRQG